jgi:hypothetical protein
MESVVFKNKGIIDERSIRTFGISAKVNDNPIGFFGTGLKYAIAICMREGLEVQILSGGQSYRFEKKVIEVRGKKFEIITMNGEEMPYTVDLGKNWQIWQAFRELYCNALDEGGEVDLIDGAPKQDTDSTQVVVTGSKFTAAYHDRGSIVLRLGSHLKVHGDNVEIYRKPSRFVFYRGIRVLNLPNQSLYTYNLIDSCDLTEDRTLLIPSYDLRKISKAVAMLKCKETIRNIVTASTDDFEHGLNYSDLHDIDSEISPEFLEVIGNEYVRNNDKMSHSARDFLIKKMAKRAVKNYESEPLTEVEQKQLDRAKMICKKILPDFENFPIVIVKSLGQTTMAMADRQENAMVISKASFKMGTKFLVSTLIEEYTHLKTGFHDCTRQLQTHLFDSICTIIEDHVIREPI